MRTDASTRWRDLPSWARRTIVAAGVVAGLLVVAAALLPVLAGPVAGVAVRSIDVEIDPDEVADLPTLEQRSVILDGAGEPLAVLHGEVDRRLVALGDVPEHVRNAVLAAEDRRFYEHEGYDERAMIRALLTNLREWEVTQGASTITQQVAQHAFLGRERTMRRKREELAYAVALEEELPKNDILERYLNAVYFGGGAYGIAAAAEEYFRVEPGELTLEQAALLAALIRAPERVSPRVDPALAEARRNTVLDAMAAEGLAGEAEVADARARPVQAEPRLERDVDAPYVIEAVKRELARLEAFGDDREERFEALFTGGLVVYTTVDRDLQGLADEVVSAAFPEDHGPTAALVSLDPRTGAIRALHGGVDFEKTQFDLATQGRRQPGSALKPVVAAAALEQGLAPDATFAGDGPLTFSPEHNDEPWEVENFAGGRHGRLGLADALTRSVNTAFAQLSLLVGTDEVVEAAGRFGVDTDAAFGDPDTWGPSIALGGLTYGVTPLELATVYAVFANEGRYAQPHLIERVETRDGEVVFDRGDESPEQVLDPGVNAAMVNVLQRVVTGGTATAAQLSGWDVLGKTGTTNERTDAWFAGATATLSTAVWMGYPDRQLPMGDVTGGQLPAQLWHEFVSAALEGEDPVPFRDARGTAALPSPSIVTVPDLTDLGVGEALVEAAEAGLVGHVVGGDASDPLRTVVHQEPSVGSRAEVGDAVELHFTEPRPEPPALPPQPDIDDRPGDGGRPPGDPPGEPPGDGPPGHDPPGHDPPDDDPAGGED